MEQRNPLPRAEKWGFVFLAMDKDCRNWPLVDMRMNWCEIAWYAYAYTLKTPPELNERWVQDRISEDPAISGLGDVVVKDKERIRPRARRLDLLFQDADSSRRYEVEIQLGSTDESHIIRTIEYWDIERKR
jgi:hypothetical protein